MTSQHVQAYDSLVEIYTTTTILSYNTVNPIYKLPFSLYKKCTGEGVPKSVNFE